MPHTAGPVPTATPTAPCLPPRYRPHGTAGELRYQPLASSITSLPPTLLAAGAGVPFEAGAPNALWAPEVPGYTRLPGESIALSGAFECQGSLRPETGEEAARAAAGARVGEGDGRALPASAARGWAVMGGETRCQRSALSRTATAAPRRPEPAAVLYPPPLPGECVLPGTLQEAADYCTRTEQCLTFAYRPGARPRVAPRRARAAAARGGARRALLVAAGDGVAGRGGRARHACT